MSEDLSMMLESLVRTEDPLTRFVKSLPDDEPHRLRSYAEGTIRLREELISTVQRMLVCDDPRESNQYATWLATHAHEVAYRWTMLMRSVTKWNQYQTDSLIFRVTGSPSEGS